jgi:hypothetical protein
VPGVPGLSPFVADVAPGTRVAASPEAAVAAAAGNCSPSRARRERPIKVTDLRRERALDMQITVQTSKCYHYLMEPM